MKIRVRYRIGYTGFFMWAVEGRWGWWPFWRYVKAFETERAAKEFAEKLRNTQIITNIP